MKLHLLTLFFLLPMSLMAQVLDTAMASIWLQKAREFQATNAWDSTAVYADRSAEAWENAARLKNDSLLWARHFQARNEKVASLGHGPDENLYVSYCEELLQDIEDVFDPDYPEIGRIYRWMGKYFFDQYRYQEAGNYFQKAIPIFEKAELPELASCYHNVGLCMRNQNELEQSIPLFLKSGRLYEQQGDTIQLSLSWQNAGIACQILGDMERAESYFFEAYNALRNVDHIYRGFALGNIGNFYHGTGDYANSITYYEEAIKIMRAKQSPALAIALANLGTVYYEMNQNEKAKRHYEQSLQVCEEKLPPNSPYTINSLNSLGSLLVKEGALEQGNAYLKKALQLARGSHLITLIYILTNLGDSYSKAGEDEVALGYYEEALAVAKDRYPPKHTCISAGLANIGFFQLNRGEYQIALDSLQKALVTSLLHYEDFDPYSHPGGDDIPINDRDYQNALEGKAQAFIEMADQNPENLLAADTCYQLVVAHIDNQRHAYKDKASKLNLQANSRQVYEIGLDLLYRLYERTGDPGYLDRAFVLLEKAKSIILGETLRASDARQLAGLPSEVQEFEKDLRTRQAWLTSTIFDLETQGGENDSAMIADLQTRQLVTKNSYDSLLVVLENQYPRYYKMKYEIGVISRKALAEKLAPEEVVLSYFVADSVMFGIAVSSTETKFHKLAIKEGLVAPLGIVRNHISSLRAEDKELFCETANELYRILIQPFAGMIQDKKLVIVADGALAYLPFEVLLSSTPSGETDYRIFPYLIRDHVITYAYSATLHFEQNEQVPGNGKFLAFAPSFNSRESGNLVAENAPDPGDMTTTVRGSLEELSGALKEVDFLRTLLEGKAFSGEKATESRFRTLSGNYDVIHLATHAIVDDQNPMDSRLLFTQTLNDTANDGDLHAWELYNMELNAQLAVLSACNTGFGKIERGEGVMSLGRAFAYAGVPSIVMSLWPAQDASTADLMKGFYSRLVDGKSKDDALREAKLEYLANAPEKLSHPFYWAGFVVQGDAGPLQKGSNTIIIPAIVLAFSLMVAGLWFWRKRTSA